MLDWLPDFLDGLFHMLSDSNREIRQAAGSAIGGFLNEIKRSNISLLSKKFSEKL